MKRTATTAHKRVTRRPVTKKRLSAAKLAPAVIAPSQPTVETTAAPQPISVPNPVVPLAAPPPLPAEPAFIPSTPAVFAEDVPLEKKNKMLYLAGTVMTVIVMLVAIGFPLVTNNSAFSSKTPTPTPAPISPTLALPTTPPVPQRSSITLDVLNGSGRAGAAKKVADQLQTLGYQIGKTGNADQSTYATTVIELAGGQSGIKDQLLQDLTSLSLFATAAGETTGTTASARVIVGKK